MNDIKYFVVLPFIIFCQPLLAEVAKVYHPYVEGHKSEFEYRALYKNTDDSTKDGTQLHRLAFGHSVTELFSLEAYITGKNLPGSSFSIEGFELEAKYQLTEQGEYRSDWGLLFELERDSQQNKWESGIGILWEKQLGHWIGSVNYFIDYEFGSGVRNEIDPTITSQIKYRWSRYFEPALELYMDEHTRGLGPVFLGTMKIGVNKLKWELGFIFGFNEETADQNYRFLIDYEF